MFGSLRVMSSCAVSVIHVAVGRELNLDCGACDPIRVAQDSFHAAQDCFMMVHNITLAGIWLVDSGWLRNNNVYRRDCIRAGQRPQVQVIDALDAGNTQKLPLNGHII